MWSRSPGGSALGSLGERPLVRAGDLLEHPRVPPRTPRPVRRGPPDLYSLDPCHDQSPTGPAVPALLASRQLLALGLEGLGSILTQVRRVPARRDALWSLRGPGRTPACNA